MEITTIDQLPEVTDLNDNDRMIVNQRDTSRANLNKVKEYMQGDLPERIDNAISEVKEYTDQLLSGRNEWLAPVNTVSQLKTTELDNKINYLCKVVADPVQSGVYQAVAGWTASPHWSLFDDTVDLVNEQELKAGISGHNTSDSAHLDIRHAIEDEACLREEAVSYEAANRDNAINAHNVSVTSHIDIRDIINNHIEQNVMSQNGVHGLRYYEEVLQAFNGREWINIAIGELPPPPPITGQFTIEDGVLLNNTSFGSVAPNGVANTLSFNPGLATVTEETLNLL